MRNNKAKLSITIGLMLILLTTFSCKKTGTITFPKSTNYGENLLAMTSGKLDAGESYSFEADLTKNSILTIIVTNTSKQDDPSIPRPRWLFTYEKGWVAGNYDYTNPVQKFETSKVGNNDFKIVFQGNNGSCKVEFYENSSSVTQIKEFTW